MPEIRPAPPLPTAVLLATVALSACISHSMSAPEPKPEQTSTIAVNLNPSRKLDMIFVVDNSKSMLPKQEKLAAQFPRLIDALKDPSLNPPLPDMRIAIIDTDVGAGRSGNCTPQFGDRGLFQMRSNTCGANSGARWLEYDAYGKGNFTGDISDVFGCLAKAVGVEGCGFEQPLQSLNLALNLKDNATGRTQADDFLRKDALLAIVILTDEDDCSMPLDSLLAEPNLASTESWSLRCATRGHACQGKNLSYPTSTSFSADFDTCTARMDEVCPSTENALSPTSCLPLLGVRQLADNIKKAKGDEGQVLVSSIFGWKRKGQDTATYRIEKAPQLGSTNLAFEYWPVCEDPNFPSKGGYDEKAWGMGATGGLRIKAFLDEFPEDNAQAFSICEPDFREAMDTIGAAIAIKLGTPCLHRRLRDVSAGEPGLQPDCTVRFRENGVVSAPIPYCLAGEAQKPCWRTTLDENACPSGPSPAGTLVPSQRIVVERANNDPPPLNQYLVMECLTCADLRYPFKDGYAVAGCE